MLAEAARAGRTCGLDASAEFIRFAEQHVSGCDFVRHDITVTPFPVSGDLMYCRFVLAHLKDPVSLVNRWAEMLLPGGLMIAEEIDDIDTGGDAVIDRYLEVNRGLVASQGARLYAGEELSRGDYDASVVINEPYDLRVSKADAAAMFHPNTVSIWEKEDYVRKTVSADERREISEALEAMMREAETGRSGGIVWKLRRLVIRR
jgi:SAM-dependent methyltransferase